MIDGSRPRPDADGARPRGGGNRRAVGEGVTDLVGRRSRRAGLRAELRPLRPLRRRAPCALRAGREGQRRRDAALRRAAALLPRRAGQSPSRRPAFATHAVVARESCVKIDPDLPLELAALFGCAVLTGVGAVVNTAKVEPGQSVAVVGLGGVGLSVVLGARLAGARQIIADRSLGRKARLRPAKLGATRRGQRRRDRRGRRRSATSPAAASRSPSRWPEPCRRSNSLTPSPRAAARQSPRACRIPTSGWPLRQLALVAEERTLKGSYVGSAVPLRDVPRMIALFRAGRLPVDELLTHRLKLEEINEGFDRLREGIGVRQVIEL